MIVMSLTLTIARIHNLFLARQANRMSHGMESFADGLHYVTSFLTVLKQILLQFNSRPLDTLGWLLLSRRLIQDVTCECLVPLQCLNQYPDGWMWMSN